MEMIGGIGATLASGHKTQIPLLGAGVVLPKSIE